MSAKNLRSEPGPVSPRSLSITLLLVSAAGLLLEMMLIRWIGTEIRIFAYLQNTVLIVCFLGLGVGCFASRRPVRLSRAIGALALLVAILSLPLLRGVAARITDLLSVLGDLVIWEQAIAQSPWHTAGAVTLGLILTFGIMLLLWEIFMPLGQILGRSIDEHPHTIWAYSLNVAGSLLGIWLFVLLSAWQTPPFLWLAAVVAMLAWLFVDKADRGKCFAYAATAVFASLLDGKENAADEVVWSPYQKLAYGQHEPNEYWVDAHVIRVNNAGYQALFDLSVKGLKANPHADPETYGLSQYDVPLLLHPRPQEVLIVGAGSGNDVAGALRRGAERITAVEIDPAIVDMGRRLHPERPYASSKVRVVEDDARSYFATADAKFDLIIFGLLDSHTTTAMTNARLDHYVYTRESLARAKSLLKEGGVMVLSFEASKPFIADRMSRCLGEVFGQPPLAFRIPLNPMGWGGVLFVAGDSDAIENQLTEHPRLARQIEKWQADHPLQLAGTTSVTTDDWPYIYLERASIPSLYVLLAALMLGLVAYGKRRLQTPWTLSRWKAPQWHFFFLGAAFLLLEVQNISKASVVLGNTWVVNAVIVSGILTMILLANFVAAKGPKLPPSVVAVGLLGSCFGLYLFDLSSLAFLPFTSKAVLVGVLTTLPMFFSGILFVDSFAKVRDKDLALGANLFGALVGGMLQTITFVIGVKALLLVVAGLYAAALLLKPKRSGDETASGANRNATDTPTLADDAPQNESQPELATV